MQAMDDLALLREYVTRHSEAAFAELVGRRIGFVYSAALRQVREPLMAEEITQAVFIILAQKAGRLSEKTVLIGWLFRTTRYTALAQIRVAAGRRRREKEVQMQPQLQAAAPDSPWEQMSPLLDEALAALGEKDRRALLLRFFENKSLAEIGNSLGMGEDTARKRIRRALEKLHRYFSKRGVSSTTAIIAGEISANSVQAVPLVLPKSVAAVAIAKGVAASTSILTLIHGALKMMAWTKAKNTVVTGGLMLIIAGMGIVAIDATHSWRAAHYPNIQGTWEGVMLLDNAGVSAGEAARTHVVLRLTKTNDVYRATTDWIEMGRKDASMGKVVYNYPFLQIERNVRDIWKLRVNADATQMILDHAIHFIQPDPILFLRTASPEPVPPRLTEAEFAPRAGSELQGYWEGKVDTGSNAVHVNLKIVDKGDGTFRAEMSWPELGAYGRPARGNYQRSLVKFQDNIGQGLFQGAVNANDTEMNGSWTHGGKSIPASLKRANYRAEYLVDADKDYSSKSKDDLQGHWKGSWVVTIARSKATIRLALNIARLPDDSYSAALYNVDQFGNDGPISPSEFNYDFPNLRLKWNQIGCTYEGTFKDGNLVGVWFQGGGGFPLTFERTGAE